MAWRIHFRGVKGNCLKCIFLSCLGPSATLRWLFFYWCTIYLWSLYWGFADACFQRVYIRGRTSWLWYGHGKMSDFHFEYDLGVHCSFLQLRFSNKMLKLSCLLNWFALCFFFLSDVDIKCRIYWPIYWLLL